MMGTKKNNPQWSIGFLTINQKEVVLKMKLKKTNNYRMNFINRFKKRKVYLSSFDGTWGLDLADVQLLSKCNKGIRYLLCAVHIFSKYAWVVPLKDKKGASIVNAFQSILDNSKRKPNKKWVDPSSEFYSNIFKNWLKDNNIEMYSTHNEEKSLLLKDLLKL